jgi:hypothetical protein
LHFTKVLRLIAAMIQLRYDYAGRVRGLPDSIRPGDDLVVELIAEHVELSEDDDLTLSLSLEHPAQIISGEWVITFGANSTAPIPSGDLTSYALGIALNRLPSIEAAGGVWVNGVNGLFTVTFNDVGARNDITLSHSALGPLTNRAIAAVEGSVSAKEVVILDFTVQTLAQSTVAVDIVESDISIVEITEGDGSNAQRDQITITRAPDAGKFQIWTAADSATRFLESSVSSYQLEMALEDIEPGEFLVSREVTGNKIVFDLARASVGANPSPTVVNTFMGPSGVTMELDGAEILQLLRIAGLPLPARAVLSFIREGQTQFSQFVNLAPILSDHGQPL